MDAKIQPQSVSRLCQAPEADLLPPVSLVALNLLLGHAQDLTKLRLREAARHACLGEGGGGLAWAHALLLGTIRNTGKRGANRSNSSSGASFSIGMCALALVARFR